MTNTTQPAASLSGSELDQLRELAEQATPGPWRWDSHEEWRPNGTMKIARLLSETAKLEIYPTIPKRVLVQESWYVFPEQGDQDYIAAASPDVILTLLAERQQDQRRIADLEEGTRMGEQVQPDCQHLGPIESQAPAYPDERKCRNCWGHVWGEPGPVNTIEERIFVLDRMRHATYCHWRESRDCVCKSGRLLLSLIEAERQSTTPRKEGE